jgi:hypothetical protein
MCDTYQAPHPRVDVIAIFAGPVLYGQLALASRSTLGATAPLIALAGWTKRVLDALGRGWIGTLARMEEVWRLDASFGLLHERDSAELPGTSIYQVGDTIVNPFLSHIALFTAVDPRVRFEAGRMTLELRIPNRSGSYPAPHTWYIDTLDSRWPS